MIHKCHATLSDVIIHCFECKCRVPLIPGTCNNSNAFGLNDDELQIRDGELFLRYLKNEVWN